MEHENELDLLFGEGTDGRAGLEELKTVVELELTPDALKNPIANEKQEQITPNEVPEEITESKETPLDESISSHNSTKIVEEQPITNNSSRVEEGTISNKNIEEMHEHELPDEISSKNYQE